MNNLAHRLKHEAKILVVDDNEMLLKFWDRLLGVKHLNYHDYHVAKNPLEALTLFKQTDFDVVITDIVMPELDGFDFVRKIWEHNPDVQLIFTTAYECDFSHVTLNNPQADQHDVHVLLKPYQDISKIEDFISRVCEDDPSLRKTAAISNQEKMRFHIWNL